MSFNHIDVQCPKDTIIEEVFPGGFGIIDGKNTDKSNTICLVNNATSKYFAQSNICQSELRPDTIKLLNDEIRKNQTNHLFVGNIKESFLTGGKCHNVANVSAEGSAASTAVVFIQVKCVKTEEKSEQMKIIGLKCVFSGVLGMIVFLFLIRIYHYNRKTLINQEFNFLNDRIEDYSIKVDISEK